MPYITALKELRHVETIAHITFITRNGVTASSVMCAGSPVLHACGNLTDCGTTTNTCFCPLYIYTKHVYIYMHIGIFINLYGKCMQGTGEILVEGKSGRRIQYLQSEVRAPTTHKHEAMSNYRKAIF